MEEALEIEELKLLYGDNWSTIYKDMKNKERLETLYNNLNKNSKELCNINKGDD